MNLNLSYNSLTFVQNNTNYADQYFQSEDAFESLCEYLQTTQTLVHLDLSGLSFEREQLKILSPILTKVNTLVAIHLSGMGIIRNEKNPEDDLMLEVLDYFGISSDFDSVPKQNVN